MSKADFAHIFFWLFKIIKTKNILRIINKFILRIFFDLIIIKSNHRYIDFDI
jgi:hypothetical protein